MRQVFRQVVSAIRRSAGPVAAPVALPSEHPARPEIIGGHIRFEGTEFLLVDDVEEFVTAVDGERRIALRFTTREYRAVRLALMKRLASRHGNESTEYRAFFYAEMVCAGCGWAFPAAYRMSLLEQNFAGGAAAHAQFARTGRCGRCQSETSLLVYERFEPADLDEEDVAAIRRSWREDARTWWANNGRGGGICDSCNDDIAPGDGYFAARAELVCGHCVVRRLSGALPRLRANPYHLGPGTLRRARAFRDP